MRILFAHMFDFSRGWGGSASMLLALHGALTDQGHRVEVVAPTFPEPYGVVTAALPFERLLTFGPEKRAGETTLDELSVPELEGMALAGAERIERDVFRHGLPDLMVAQHISLMALVCLHLHRKFGIPYRIISYGTDTRLLLQDARYREMFLESARAAERILAISGFTAREVEATVGGRVEVLGGAVDPGLFFTPRTVEKIPGRLVYFGRLVSEKGIGVLLEAITRQHSAAGLALAGEGPLRAGLEARLAQWTHPCRVELLGHLPQARLRDVLSRAEAVVVPSTWAEPLGLVVLEAFACGVPVIASAVGGIPEMIADGETGLLVPGGDAGALAAAIDRLLGDRALLRRMAGAVGRMKVPSFHDLAARLVR